MSDIKAEIDVMRDVYMTRQQREAFDRIVMAATHFTPQPETPAGGEVAVLAAAKAMAPDLVGWDGLLESEQNHYIGLARKAMTATHPPAADAALLSLERKWRDAACDKANDDWVTLVNCANQLRDTRAALNHRGSKDE